MTGKNRTRLVGLEESAGWGMKMNGRRENCGWDVLHKNLFSIKKKERKKISRRFKFESASNNLFTKILLITFVLLLGITE